MITTDSVNIHRMMTASKISSASASAVGSRKLVDTRSLASFKFVSDVCSSVDIFASLPIGLRQLRSNELSDVCDMTPSESCVTKHLSYTPTCETCGI